MSKTTTRLELKFARSEDTRNSKNTKITIIVLLSTKIPQHKNTFFYIKKEYGIYFFIIRSRLHLLRPWNICPRSNKNIFTYILWRNLTTRTSLNTNTGSCDTISWKHFCCIFYYSEKRKEINERRRIMWKKFKQTVERLYGQ